MRIVHISDTHISTRPGLRERRLRDLARSVTAINALRPMPALVLHTGDAANLGDDAEYALLRGALEKLNCPWVVLPGNRDSRPAMRRAFSDRAWLPDQAPWLDFVIDVGPLTVLALDTRAAHTNKGWLDATHRQRLRSLLRAHKERPVLMAMHHPPFALSGLADPHSFADWEQVRALADIVAGFPRVQLIASGHSHRFMQGQLAHAPAITIPSTASDLRKGAARKLGEAPALMLYDFQNDGTLAKWTLHTPATAGTAP